MEKRKKEKAETTKKKALRKELKMRAENVTLTN